MAKANTRAGFVALIGAPNAGKSTLLNAFMGAKLAIVTHKVQTTRNRISGITVRDKTQIIFVDTPGIFLKTKRRLERAMVDAAWKGVRDADFAVLLVDAKKGLSEDVAFIVNKLKEQGTPTVLALNKIDTVKREKLLELADALNKASVFSDIFMISALNGEGVNDLFDHIANQLPEGPWLYPEDQMTTIPQRFLASEITREKVFLNLHQELPYVIAVETIDWKEKKDGSIRIEQNILCDRANHKAMVIGKQGAMLKKIGAAARAELADILGRKVHLFLFAKVSPNWADKPYHYHDIGLDFVE